MTEYNEMPGRISDRFLITSDKSGLLEMSSKLIISFSVSITICASSNLIKITPFILFTKASQ